MAAVTFILLGVVANSMANIEHYNNTNISANNEILNSTNLQISAPNLTNSVYLLVGVAPIIYTLNFSSDTYANISNLKSLTILEYVAMDLNDFLNFISLHSETLEKIILYKVTLTKEAVYKKPGEINIPKLKELYINWEDTHSGSWEYHGFLFQHLLPFIGSAGWMGKIWGTGVDLAVIEDGKTTLEIDHTQKMLKSATREEDWDNVNTTLNILALSGPYWVISTGLQKFTKNLHTLILRDVQFSSKSGIGVEAWVAGMQNLTTLSYSQNEYQVPPTPIDMFPPSLKNLTINVYDFIGGKSVPHSPITLDNLWVTYYHMDAEVQGNIDKYYNARRIGLSSSTVPLLKSLLRMKDAEWIYSNWKYKNELKRFLCTEFKLVCDTNSTHFILERNTQKTWGARILTNGEIKVLEKDGYNVENKWKSVMGSLKQEVEALIENQGINGNSTLTPNALLFGGKPAKYGTLDRNRTNLRNITILEYTNIESSEFLELLESNKETIEYIHMRGNTRSGIYNGTVVVLRNLKTLIIQDKSKDRPVHFTRIEALDRISNSIIPFLSTNRTGYLYTLQRNPAGSEGYSISVDRLWEEGVDIIYESDGKQILELNHARGFAKSIGGSLLNVCPAPQFMEGGPANESSTDGLLNILALHSGRIPSKSCLDFSKVSILILYSPYGQLGNFLNKFTALKELRLQPSWWKMAISYLPKTLQKLTLEYIILPQIVNNNTNNVVNLEELNLSRIYFPNNLHDGSINALFNARNISLEQWHWPYPVKMLTSATNMTRAEWIFVEVSRIRDSLQYSQNLADWNQLLQGYGLPANTTEFILERKAEGAWIGRKVGEEVVETMNKERIRVEQIYEAI